LDQHHPKGKSNAQPCKQRADKQNIRVSDRRIDPQVRLEEVVGAAIPIVWDDFGVGDMFRQEAERLTDRFDADAAYGRVVSGAKQLWLILDEKEEIKAALITDASSYTDHGQKYLTIEAIVGKQSRSWLHLQDALAQKAKAQDCTKLEASVRPGLARLLKRDGWVPVQILVEKSID